MIVIDNNSKGHLFISRDESIIPIQDWPENSQKVIWDIKDTNLFTVVK